MAAKKLKIPVVWHLRSSYAVSNSPLQAKISCQRIRHAADHLIAISEDETDRFEDLQNLSIIYNSVDFGQVAQAMERAGGIRAEFGIGKDEMLVGTVSTSLNENRGSWDFIKAAEILQTKLPNTKLRFIIVANISKAELESEAWKRAEESGIRRQLILTGFRSDALSIMAAMDIIAICSRRGVLGRMPFEAMALGRPLVVTAGHSGKSHVVVDGQTALVVPAANPQAIADGMERLLQFPMLREQLSQQGKIYAREHFDLQKNAQAVMKIYKEILAS
jgi:glycosyltransferase involved in cell wall biosynthesis